MIVTDTKYYCDYCNKEIDFNEYKKGTKVTLIADLENPKGGCGAREGISLKLCNECSKNIGIVNDKEYHSYTYSNSRLKAVIEKNKNKILKLFFKK